MPGIVITGHGGFASGLLQAVEQVVGEQPACIAVDFPVHMGTAELKVALSAALQAVEQADGVVFLTDMLGDRLSVVPASWPMRMATVRC